MAFVEGCQHSNSVHCHRHFLSFAMSKKEVQAQQQQCVCVMRDVTNTHAKKAGDLRGKFQD
jgi:hypothetical protein